MKQWIVLLLVFISTTLIAQSTALNVYLDGTFDEWKNISTETVDPQGDGALLDILSLKVANGSGTLFLLIEVTPEYKLLDNNSLTVYIDGDNNPATGLTEGDIGAELEFTFGERSGKYHANGSQTDVHWSVINFASLPTVTDTKNEIRVNENAQVNGNAIFTSDTIKIVIKDKVNSGDRLPDAGSVIYVFDRTPLDPIEPISLERENEDFLRIMNYNIEFDGLVDPQRQPHISRILNAIEPDIICFNEFFNTDLQPVLDAMNIILPLDNGSGWYGVKEDPGNITVSKYPIIQSWQILGSRRITASLIDLPEPHESNVIVINSHYKCCDGDQQRQEEADATIAWLLDGISQGDGEIDFAPGLPFVILGDLNLVGFRQQLTTLLTGNIVNTAAYGEGAPPDWDNTDLSDLISRQTDNNSAITWFSSGSSFPPGRLDYMIYSNSVLNVEKAFTLRTDVMPQNRLNEYGLQQDDTEKASDHCPKVADFTIIPLSGSKDGSSLQKDYKLYQNYPNPFNPSTEIGFSLAAREKVSLRVYDILGQEIRTLLDNEMKSGYHKVNFNADGLASGIYFYRLSSESYSDTKEMILLR